MSNLPTDIEDWQNLRLDAIADLPDKRDECRYFLYLASVESELKSFRWLLSAFFGAAYSYFEIAALRVYERYVDPETGRNVEDSDNLDILMEYVLVLQNTKNPQFVKTAGKHPTIKKLYEYRKANTHHYPLLVMSVGDSTPEDFQLGGVEGKGVPALGFCNEVMSLLEEVESRIS